MDSQVFRMGGCGMLPALWYIDIMRRVKTVDERTMLWAVVACFFVCAGLTEGANFVFWSWDTYPVPVRRARAQKARVGAG